MGTTGCACMVLVAFLTFVNVRAIRAGAFGSTLEFPTVTFSKGMIWGTLKRLFPMLSSIGRTRLAQWRLRSG